MLMKYKEVIRGFADGTIDKNLWMVEFDNDGGNWSYIGPDSSDMEYEARHKLENVMGEKYGEPDGYADVVNIANAAGIPSGWV